MSDFHYHLDAAGVAVITWDVTDRSHNVMSWQGFEDLNSLIEKGLADDKVRGIVLTSAKNTFTMGMDLGILQELGQYISEPSKIHSALMGIHKKFRRMELAGYDPQTGQSGKPITVAINGTALGIGYEIALSVHRIICADNPDASIGLPEVKVGLFPGAGGTTRLARRLGLMASGQFILQGKTLRPREALAANLIDELVPPEELLDRAKEWVLNAGPEDLIKPWDNPKGKIPGGRPYDKQGFLTFMGASAMSAGQSQNVYPAVKAALSTIYEGFMVPFDQAIRIEANWFTQILKDPSSAAMIRSVFISRKVLENGARRPKGIAMGKIAKIGVIGAGMMGAGIAFVAARNGLDVTLLDQELTRADSGKNSIKELLAKERSRGRVDDVHAEQTLDNIRTSDRYDDLGTCQMVVEAVFEDPAVKGEVFQKLDPFIAPECIVASNTSTLPISSLSENVSCPERFLGMHFFSPVHKMSLVEIIRSHATSDQATALAFDFIRKIRKTPIIVNDRRFFYANRCIIPYINEGVALVGEGCLPALVENASRQIGMPVGPLQLIDETSLELAVHIAKASKAALGDKYEANNADRVVFELAKRGRLGRKVGAGFYEYDNDGKRLGLWPGLMDLFPPLGQQPDVEAVKNRLLLIQVVEAVKCLEEGVLEDVREGDVAAIYGWGFAPWSGGPFTWLDNLGTDAVMNLCRSLSSQFGERFKAPDLLSQLNDKRQLFYEFNKSVPSI